MAKLHFGYLEHLVSCLEGKKSKQVIKKTITQLEKLIKEEKDKIKGKECNRKASPLGNYS